MLKQNRRETALLVSWVAGAIFISCFRCLGGRWRQHTSSTPSISNILPPGQRTPSLKFPLPDNSHRLPPLPGCPGEETCGPERWPDPEISQAAGMGSSTEGVLATTLICGVPLSDSGSRNRQLNYTCMTLISNSFVTIVSSIQGPLRLRSLNKIKK